MKILFIISFYFLSFSIIAQSENCDNTTPIKFKIYDKSGNEKYENFCEGETLTFKTDSLFAEYGWSTSDYKYSSKNFMEVKVPDYGIAKLVSLRVKNVGCDFKFGNFNLTTAFTNDRIIFAPDSANIGEAITISASVRSPGDVFTFPDLTQPTEGYYEGTFNDNLVGKYTLSNEVAEKVCGFPKVEKFINLSKNANPSVLEITPQYGLFYCYNFMIENNFIAKNFKVKDPIFKLFISGSSSDISGIPYPENFKMLDSKFYFSGQYSGSFFYPYVYLKEMKSGKVSNIIGPFKELSNTSIIKNEDAFDIISKPSLLLMEGDSTVFQIKNKSESKIFWYKNGIEITEFFNKEKLIIKESGSYFFKLSFTNKCYNYLSENNADVRKFSLIEFVASSLTSTYCSNKVRLSLPLSDYNVKGLIFNWKKDGKVIAQTNENNLYVTQVGDYSCEVVYKGKAAETDVNRIDNFKGTNRLFNDANRGGSNFCKGNSSYNLAITDASIFVRKNYLNFSNSDSLKYNWYIDDILQESHEPILQPISNKNNVNLQVQIIDGECDYFSENFKVQFKNLGYKFPKKKYEYCEGEVAIFDPAGGVGDINRLSRKIEWYKDGKPFYTGFIGGTPYADMETTEPGKYNFIQYYLKSIDSNVYDSDCLVISDTIEVVFKKEIKLKNSKYFNSDFTKQLCSPSLLKLNFNGEFKSYSWYFENEKIADSLTSALKSQITTKMDKVGNYYAKLNVTNNCTVVSDSLYYNGKPNFNLTSFNLCSNPTLSVKESEESITYYKTNPTYNFKLSIQNENTNIETFAGIYAFINKSGTYTAYATSIDGKCKLESNPLKVELPSENFNLNFNDSLKICDGKIVELMLADTSKNKLIYWYKNGELIKDNNFTLPIITSGTYKALFKDKICDRYNFSMPLHVSKLPIATATISGGGSIDYGKTTDLKFELTSQAPWEFGLNTGEKFTINKSHHTISVKPLSDIKYSIASLKNICGEGTSSGEANIKVIILAEEQDLESNMALKVFPIPVLQNCEIEIIDAFSKNCIVELYDATAKVILTEQLNFENTKANKTLALSNLPAGTYTLKVQIGKKILMRKLVK